MSAPFVCNLCGGGAFRQVVRPRGAALDIVRCASCGLILAHPFPDRTQLLERYDADYFHCASPIQGGYEDYVADGPAIRKTFERRLKLFLPSPEATGEGRAVLDVGCATGIFLEVMAARGWRAEGIEISPFAREEARKKGFRVSDQELERFEAPDASFDLITMWDVIEHVADPLSMLKACARLLKPGGRLVLTTPDASAPLARLLGGRWVGYQCVGEHVYFFGRGTMKAYMEKAGLRVLSMTGVGKYLLLDRIITRLSYYTRVFRVFSLLPRRLRPNFCLYAYSGDTLCATAQKPGAA